LPTSPATRRRCASSSSDARVDVVVWWRFADDRAGAPVLLAQCPVQIEWGEKANDLADRVWGVRIRFSCCEAVFVDQSAQ
jgi:hypothetical protein